MPNTNTQINTRDLRNAALAWQSPQLVQTAGHEIRSFIWLGVILFIVFAVGASWTKKSPTQNPALPSRQAMFDFRQVVKATCVRDLVARGYNQFSNNNCSQIADIQTYNQFGRLP